MNKKGLILLLALVVLIAGSTVLYNRLAGEVEVESLATGETVAVDTPEETEAVPANLAPDFTVYDLEGNAHTLSEFRGKPVILNFWASWCGPCKSEMPDFQAQYEALGQEIQFVMVNLTDGSQETVDSAHSYIRSQGYTFPVYYDTDYSAAIAYAVQSIPATYFLNAEGALVAYGKGALTAEVLQRGIDMLMK